MNINWKLRIKNKTFWITLIGVAVPFVYDVLGMFGLVPSITQSMAADLLIAALNVLAAIGIVVDPTTAGVADSDQAMQYQSPKGETP